MQTTESFEAVWARIKAETPLKTLVQLGELTETSHPTVSRKKKEGAFPVGWAFVVAGAFGLNTDWIMTGYGPKRIDEIRLGLFQGSLAEWLQEQCQEDPNFYREFMADCAAFFPRYAEWLRSRKASETQGRP